MRKLKPTAPKLYRLRNVIRKPNPTKIITWTSWKPTAKEGRDEDDDDDDDRNWHNQWKRAGKGGGTAL